MSFIYLLLGRWDYLVSQADDSPMVDGVKRFPSMWHVSSMAHLHKAEADSQA